MGWSWTSDGDSGHVSSPAGDFNGFYGTSNPNGNDDGDRCATRKVVKSQCHTEEVEPGKYIRKCEKTEQIFKDCVGRPSEMVQFNKEYTEEDVTDQIVKGSFPLDSIERDPFFPGLRSDIDAIERSLFGGIGRFLEAAEEMKNDFFRSVGIPDIYDDDSSSSGKRRGIHVEAPPPKEALHTKNPEGHIDLSGLARDV